MRSIVADELGRSIHVRDASDKAEKKIGLFEYSFFIKGIVHLSNVCMDGHTEPRQLFKN
jgi:hypothetical protein